MDLNPVYSDYCLLLLSFLNPYRNIGHQQRQLFTELLTGPVVSNQARFCLDSCTPFPQFVSTPHKMTPFFTQYHLEGFIAQLVGPLKIQLFAEYAQSSPIYAFNDHINLLHFQQIHIRYSIWPINVKNERQRFTNI